MLSILVSKIINSYLIITMKINLCDFTEFAKVKDIWNDCNRDKFGLHEFLNNVVMNFNDDSSNGYGKMLPELSDIYVLVSNDDFPFDKLTSANKNMINMSSAKRIFVLGYIQVCPWILENDGCIPYHFINFIDSRISGLDIAKYMIEQYEEAFDEERYLFPFEIMIGAEKYWRKYFTEIYEIRNKQELKQMIYEYKFKNCDIRWDELFVAFDV